MNPRRSGAVELGKHFKFENDFMQARPRPDPLSLHLCQSIPSING